jgi:5-methyltetrahydrofolate--homocysteine methyltransferase
MPEGRLDDVDEIAQTRDGAHLLDLCVDDFGRSRVADLGELARWLATAGAVPILLYSTEVALGRVLAANHSIHS